MKHEKSKKHEKLVPKTIKAPQSQWDRLKATNQLASYNTLTREAIRQYNDREEQRANQ